MDHHDGGVATGSSTVDIAALVLRLALLLATAFLAGTGLLRPLVGELSRKVWITVGALGGLSAALAVVSALKVDVNVFALGVHVVLALAVPVLLRRPSAGRWASVALIILVVLETSLGASGIDFAVDTVYVAGAAIWFGVTLLSGAEWRTSNFRRGPLSLTIGGLLVLAAIVQFALSGIGFDRRLYGTLFGVALIVIIVVPIAVTTLAGILLKHGESRVYRVGAAGVALGFVAWSALAAVPQPAPLPIPGVPLLARADGSPLLLSPQRPGRNVVHLPASAGDDVTVGIEGGLISKAFPRPGAEGIWADVDLPQGRSDLVIRHGDRETTVEVDAGQDAGPVITDADAPECAGAALGGLIAERADVLKSCPADALSADDGDALVKLVNFLAERKPSAITLVEDKSPRGIAAAALVRDTAAKAGLAVQPEAGPNTALLVTAGWSDGYVAMTRAAESQRLKPTHQFGLYLAPWLFNGPIVNSVASASLPLRFDPREQLAVTYAVAVHNAFGGESPTPAGFRGWLGDQKTPAKGEVQIFAAAQVNAMPMYPNEPHAPGMVMNRDYAGQWVPNGTIVPISNILR